MTPLTMSSECGTSGVCSMVVAGAWVRVAMPKWIIGIKVQGRVVQYIYRMLMFVSASA